MDRGTIGPVPDPADDACCAACAARPSSAVRRGAPLPVLDRPSTTGRPTTNRSTDRRIAFGGLLLAAGFLAAALLGLAHLVVGRTGLWVSLHLALAGGAGTAIAAILPFFSAALAAAPAADPRLRVLGIAAVAGGAAMVSVAVPLSWTVAAVLAGSAYVAGMLAVGVAATRPLRTALGVRRPIVERAYLVAIGCVSTGVLLAIATLGGVGAFAERWALLKPAHAWLNVFGFVGLVVAATLVHFAPTVAGGRIRPRRSARLAIGGLAAGPPLVAIGYGFDLDAVARAGALVVLAGAAGLVVHGVAVHLDRARWTTDAGWHRLTSGSLLAAPAWLLLATAIAAGRIIELGADPAAWSLGLVAAPLGLGFAVQILVGAWTHLVPAIGPGDPAAHARQRRQLGRSATVRLGALQLGSALAWVGGLAASGWLIGIGLLLAGGAAVTAIALLLGATVPPRRVVVAAPS